ncbi:hypothetical protein N0V82_004381 [Gnomoniopsis sp. IMI 355080]|nr:hypothetical protein N0V82_004381 [Gnomoniopsis sp. IMI 355080]
MVSTEPEARARPAKVGHRKSRNGCTKCKSRRVKCDEVRPICGNCDRLQMDCFWPERNPNAGRYGTRSQPTPSPNPPVHVMSPSATTNTASTSTAYQSPEQGATAYLASWPHWTSDENPFTQLDDTQGISLPESKARRMMEHRLMHHWHLNFSSAFPVNPAESWRSLWARHIPALGLSHDNVLFGMLAMSATRMLRTCADDKDIFAARQTYFISALHAQRQEVAKLCVENAEGVCFGALLISVNSFAMLKERALEPYQPPMEWLQLGRGAGTVIWQSVETIIKDSRESQHPALMTIATAYPYFGRDQSYFDAANRRSFEGVLTQHIPSEDDWNDEETREAYEKTLSYVGSIQRGIQDGEPVYAVARRIQTFALLVPPRFIGLLSLQRPRALVVMAHFWATVSQVHTVWWLGDPDAAGEESTAMREIGAIKKALPKEWMTTMVWPLDQVGLRDIAREHSE